MTNKARVFEFLYKNLDGKYNINQLSRLVGISVGSAFKILKEFEKQGYVHTKRKNNAVLYRINANEKARKAFNTIESERNSKTKHRTKVMCTIGRSSSISAIINLIERGMDAARIDASRHSPNYASVIIKNIREAADYIPILIDIPGKNIASVKPWIKFAVKNDLDFVSVSYVSNSDEVEAVYRYLGYSSMKDVIGGKIKLFVKIEEHALMKYREIIENAYGIILDRNLLATGKNYETLPQLQKSIIAECNRHGKPAIVGSQILESMNKNRFPSKAEVYDIANAVLDKVSCLMLSDETDDENYPAEAAGTLVKIIKNVEMGQALDGRNIGESLIYPIGASIFEEDNPTNLDAILIITSGGYTARIVSGKRPGCKIIAATSSKKIFRQLNILWGVEPLFIGASLEDISNEEKKEALLKALEKGFIKKIDQIAIIASVFHSKSKRANLLEVHKVNEFLDYVQDKIKHEASVIPEQSERDARNHLISEHERKASLMTKIAKHY